MRMYLVIAYRDGLIVHTSYQVARSESEAAEIIKAYYLRGKCDEIRVEYVGASK